LESLVKQTQALLSKNNQQKKNMAAVARGIGETGSAVQLNGFLGKLFYFYNLFSQSVTLPVYLFVSLLVNLQFFILLFFSAEIVQGFSLNFINQIARTLGRPVDKLLNGSRVNSHGQSTFGKQSSSLFRGNTAFHILVPRGRAAASGDEKQKA